MSKPSDTTRLPISRITSKNGGGGRALLKPLFLLSSLLEWFLKSLLPYISKDVSTSGVTNEEESILSAQQLDLIYSQFGILYEIIPKALRPTHDVENPKPRPHANGVG